MWPLFLFVAVVAGVLLDHWWRERRHQRHLSAQRQVYTSTALREHQHTAARTRAEQRALFDSMQEGVLLLDRAGCVKLANPSLRAMMQAQDDGQDRPLQDWVPLAELSALAARVATEGRVTDIMLSTPGTPPRWLHVNGAAIAEADGMPQGVILVFHDITRLKQLEETRQEFVANVSHELRTPLSIIKGCAETLLETPGTDAGQRDKLLRMIDRHADRLAHQIDDLLVISQLESGRTVLNRQPLSLRDAAQHALDDFGGRAAERQVVLANEVPDALQAFADADRLQQVFSNLVENAIKYGREGGRVAVGAQALKAGMEVTVHDDGPGIPAEVAGRVFERFFRVDKARSRETGGTGLGLAIVKHIVQAHGGQVRVESAPGHGTTFAFTLPDA